MTKKILFTSLILFGFVLFGITEVFFADTSPELEQAKSNILSLIKEGNYAEAEVQTQKLLTDFSEHKDIASTLWQIAKGYEQSKKYDRAFQLHQYNVEHFPSDKYAMWSQVEIVYSHIRAGNDAAADAACNKLLTVFSNQPTLPKEVYQIATRYNESLKPDKALALHRYSAEHFSKDDIYLMWSQAEVIKSHIRGGDYAAADAACNKLLTAFSRQPTLPKEIYQVAMEFNKAGKEDRAFQLHQYNAEHFSKDDMYLMWSQVEVIYSYIHDGNDAAADAALDKLLTVFSQQPTLPKEIYQVAMKFKKAGKEDRAFQLHQYNADHSSKDDIYTMWSQVEVIKSYIRDANDAVTDAACDKLLTAFSQQPTLLKEIYEVASAYDGAGRNDKASQLYQYVIDNQSKTEDAIWAKVSMAKLNILLGNEAAVEAALDSLIADCNNHPKLPEVVYRVGEEYGIRAFQCESNGREAEARDYYQKARLIWERIIQELPPSEIFTPQAYYAAGNCYFQLGEYEKAIEYCKKVVDNWPDFMNAWHVHFLKARCYEKLEQSGRISTADAAAQIRQVYEKLLTDYSSNDSQAAAVARSLLKRWGKK